MFPPPGGAHLVDGTADASVPLEAVHAHEQTVAHEERDPHEDVSSPRRVLTREEREEDCNDDDRLTPGGDTAHRGGDTAYNLANFVFKMFLFKICFPHFLLEICLFVIINNNTFIYMQRHIQNNFVVIFFQHLFSILFSTFIF